MTSQLPEPNVSPASSTPPQYAAPPQYPHPNGQSPYVPGPYASTPSRPGRVLGIVGFALSFVFPLDVVGLVLCIVAMVQSRRAGHRNGFALAGIIISAVGILFCAAILAVLVPVMVDLFQTCGRLGTGIHHVGGATYTCTPTSVNKTWG